MCRDPQTAEEEELVENLFDATCSALMLPDNKALFVQAEGEPGRAGPGLGLGACELCAAG